jgi:hypothetical protein
MLRERRVWSAKKPSFKQQSVAKKPVNRSSDRASWHEEPGIGLSWFYAAAKNAQITKSVSDAG